MVITAGGHTAASVVWFVVNLLIQFGRPIIGILSRVLRPTSGGLADLLIADGFQSVLAVVITLALLAILGRAANCQIQCDLAVPRA